MRAYRLLLALIVIDLLFAALSPTLAHAELRRSSPVASAVLERAPDGVLAWFSQRLSTGSKLTVFDTHFQVVDKGETLIDASDATLMRVGLTRPSPGRYTVNWKATAIDGHVSSGSYDFAVIESSDSSLLIIIAAVVGLTAAIGLVWWARRRTVRIS